MVTIRLGAMHLLWILWWWSSSIYTSRLVALGSIGEVSDGPENGQNWKYSKVVPDPWGGSNGPFRACCELFQRVSAVLVRFSLVSPPNSLPLPVQKTHMVLTAAILVSIAGVCEFCSRASGWGTLTLCGVASRVIVFSRMVRTNASTWFAQQQAIGR